MLTIDKETVIALLYACENTLDEIENRPKPRDEEEAATTESCRIAVLKAHSLLQVAYCGVKSVEETHFTTH